MRHLKTLTTTLMCVVVGLPVLLTGAAAGKAPSGATVVPAEAFTAMSLPTAPPTEPPTLAAPVAPVVPTARPEVIWDIPIGVSPRSISRAKVEQPDPIAHVVAKATPKPKARSVKRTSFAHSAVGVPTYYCWAGHSRCTSGYPDVAGKQMYAAAGPSLRVGNWRGRVVAVTGSNGVTIRVKLIDFCACGGDHFIDLYHDAFVALGAPRRATVSW